MAPGTKVKAIRKLSAVLRMAVADGVIKRNPAEGVSRPKLKGREGRALSDEEMAKIIEAAEDVHPDTAGIVWCMVRAGLRIGEVLALKRADVDLADRTIHVGASMSRREGVTSPKGKSERTILIPADLAERLRQHLAGTVASIDGWLFTAAKGGRVRYNNWRSRLWERIVELADIGEVRPHDLRHTCLTRPFLKDGWSLPAVQRFAGHADPTLTLRVYTHVMAEDLPVPQDVDSLWTGRSTGTDERR